MLTLCEHLHRHHLPFYQISARSDFKYGRQVANDVKFGIVKTIIFLLAGYSYVHVPVDENKIQPIELFCTYLLHSAISKCIEIISNPTFPSALSSNFGNIMYIMYEPVWTNQIRPFNFFCQKKRKQTYFPHLNPRSWRLRQNFNIPWLRTYNFAYIVPWVTQKVVSEIFYFWGISPREIMFLSDE
jgi:hypothetical protein